MDKSKPTQPEEQSLFTEPEMEAALQLIQLSGESDVDLHPYELSTSACDVLLTTNKNRRRKEVADDDESQGSCTSDMTSARRFVTPWFLDEDDDNDGVAGSRRKRKKFRSVIEIYEISN